MSITNITAASCPAGQTGPVQGSDSINAFMIVLMSMLQDIDSQQEGISAAMEKERLLKAEFDQQKKIVKKAAKLLQALVKEGGKLDPENIKAIQKNLREVQAQISVVQAEQSKLSFVQNKMVQCFKRDVDPAQTMIQSDSVMFGGALHSYLLTQRVKL